MRIAPSFVIVLVLRKVLLAVSEPSGVSARLGSSSGPRPVALVVGIRNSGWTATGCLGPNGNVNVTFKFTSFAAWRAFLFARSGSPLSVARSIATRLRQRPEDSADMK
ncbi:hypothetical protein EDB89DRAFT_1913932 [Lactarius sanguifluus]|nr:hypothetical protein EDB89DRAFT_1913932 [Lactarius sanguifluus]